LISIKSILAALGLAACLVLAACGQRGPLYLPEEKAGTVTTADEISEEDESGDSEGKKDEETP